MARCPFAVFRGPVPNRTIAGRAHPCRGLVLHVEVGTETGTDGWFHNPQAQASADFGIAKDGTIHQWVDTDDKAWAEATGNPYWYSVETEGVPGEPLTSAQVTATARLLVWLSQLDHFPLQVTDDPHAGQGLITHGDGGAAWGGHYDCPGPQRAAQRVEIVRQAIAAAQPPPGVTPMFAPAITLRPIVASLPHPNGGSVLLADNADVYAFDAPYNGAPEGKPYFEGRKPAKFELRPGAAGTMTDPWYRVVATSGEHYGDGGF